MSLTLARVVKYYCYNKYCMFSIFLIISVLEKKNTTVECFSGKKIPTVEGLVYRLETNTILLQNFSTALEQRSLLIEQGLVRCLASDDKMVVFPKWKYSVSD